MEAEPYTKLIIDNPFERPGARKNSVYIGDTAFGDSGKGVVTAEFNRLLVVRFGQVYSLRVNGGGNAGHDMEIDGIPFLANQLPVAVAQEHAVALVTRGMVFNPRDAVLEIERTLNTFGGKMPGQLQIDDRTPLCLDTHRVLDRATGSTGRGIGPAYADLYGRKEITIRDLFAEDWERRLGSHYDEKIRIIRATLQTDCLVKRLDNTVVPLGTKDDFLGRLAEDKQVLEVFINPAMRKTLQEIWANENIPVTIEEAQGPGLDPFLGIRPDVTSSRPSVRHVHDGTHGVVFGEDIALKLGVTKTLYMSSVGSRWLPGEMPLEEACYYHAEFGEYGKTTKRKRGIYYLSIPILRSLRRFAGYDYLVATHIDAARANVPVKIVSYYINQRGELVEYSYYQDEIDQLVAHYMELPGWDGEACKDAKVPAQLDLHAREMMAFLSNNIAPVIMARTGKNIGDHIAWWNI